MSEEKKSASIEEAFEELDRIIRILEDKDTPLDEALKQYEKGVGIVKSCNETLNDTEKKILILKGNNVETADKDEF